MRTYGTSETFNVTPSRIVNIIMLNMLVGMKDSNVKYIINDLAASQDKKPFCTMLHPEIDILVLKLLGFKTFAKSLRVSV